MQAFFNIFAMNSLFTDKICRTCMKNEGKLRSIFSTNKKLASSYSEMLQICISLQVTEDDELPKEICSKCVYNLSALYQFRQTCFKSDQTFRERLSENNAQESDLNYLIVQENDSEPENKEDILVPVKFEDDLLTKSEIEDDPEQQTGVQVAVNEEKCLVNSKKSRKKCAETKKRQSKPHQCEICGKFLSCHSNLVQHMRRHTGERPFKCDLCEKAFSRAEHLTIHKRTHSGERPHSCEICGKSFVQHAALTCHLRTHSGARPYVCPACGKAFAQAVTLTYHMRTHTGETPYVCSLCGKGFTHSGNLNIHMRFHNGDRPFVCTHCGQRFVTSSHLSVHVKQHTGERNHRCNVCGKAFVRKEHLRSHAASHAGIKNFACVLCGKRYGQSSHLSRHMKTHKNIDGQPPQNQQIGQQVIAVLGL